MVSLRDGAFGAFLALLFLPEAVPASARPHPTAGSAGGPPLSRAGRGTLVSLRDGVVYGTD